MDIHEDTLEVQYVLNKIADSYEKGRITKAQVINVLRSFMDLFPNSIHTKGGKSNEYLN